MLDLLITLLAGVVFGLALAAPPGPMNAVIAEESVQNGWGAGFRAGLGAATADFVFFVLSLLGVVAFVQRFPTVQAAMVTVGGVLMLYFAYGAARGVGETFRGVDEEGRGPETVPAEEAATAVPAAAAESVVVDPAATGFRKAFVLALTNPYQLLFWLTIGVGLLDPGRIDLAAETFLSGVLPGSLVVETGSPALVVGFFGGIACWITGFPAALVSAERRVEAVAPLVAGGSALLLAGFGIAFLYDGLANLVG